MKALPWILVVLLTLAMCSCRSVQYVPVETKVLDSIVIHDTTFQEKLIPYKDSVAIPDTVSLLSNPYAYSYARWSDGVLHHSLGIYPLATVTVKVPYYIEKIRQVEVPKPYPVEKKLTKWEKMKIDIGGMAICFIIAFVLTIAGRVAYRRLKK